MQRLDVPPESSHGIDLSHYQVVDNFGSIKSAGVEFAYLKATEGLRTVDPNFARFGQECRWQKILHGAYHFFHPTEDPGAQAKFFCGLAGSAHSELPPVMDWETTDGVPANHDIENARTFLMLVEKASRRVPIIYGSPSFLSALNLPIEFARYPLWIADYDPTGAEVPAPWDRWTFWQYSKNVRIRGIGPSAIGGECDGNYFWGKISAGLFT